MILKAKFADDSLFNFWQFKQIQDKSTTSWNYIEETSEIGKKYFGGCRTPWLKHVIYAIMNIGVKILMYIQIFSWKQLQTKPDRYFDEANEKSGKYFK